VFICLDVEGKWGIYLV